MGLTHHHARNGHAGHSHAPAEYGPTFALAVALNIGFVIIEGGAGLWSGSIALVADAGHNLSDVLGLLIAWAAYALSKRPASTRYTYGLRGSSILAALFNAVFLFIACGAITLGAIQRFFAPAPVEGGTIMIVAAIGIVINLGTALLFLRGREHDLNIRGAFLHMAADAGVSAGVVAAGFLVTRTGLLWIDPTISLLIVAIILIGTWGLFRDALAMSLAGVPSRIDPDRVAARLAAMPGVAAIHHLHIWPTSTTETAMTAHLLMPEVADGDDFLIEATRLVRSEFAIGHATFQIEHGRCADTQSGCVDHEHNHDHDHHHDHDH